MKLLIGTVNLNNRCFTELFLDSLNIALKNVFSECKIIIIDNGSDDNIMDLNEKYPFADFIRNDSNMGVSYAWNQIIKEGYNSCGEPVYDYYLICNNDIYWTKDSLENFELSINKYNITKEFGWISFMMNDYKEVEKTGMPEIAEANNIYFGNRPNPNKEYSIQELKNIINSSYSKWGGIESFANTLVSKYDVSIKQMHTRAPLFALSKDCVDKVGLFDELNTPVGINEDSDYCRRINNFSNFKKGAAIGSYIHHFSMMTRTKSDFIDNWVTQRNKFTDLKWRDQKNYEIKLDIGSGERPQEGPGWYHMDLDPSMPHLEFIYDSSRPLPFPDNTINEIYCSNSLEHIGWRKVPEVLQNWYNCLKSNSKLHLRVPNFRYLVRQYINGTWKMSFDPKAQLNAMHGIFGGEKGATYPHIHKAGFDENNLRDLLTKVGFNNIQNVSDDGSWELRINAFKGEPNA